MFSSMYEWEARERLRELTRQQRAARSVAAPRPAKKLALRFSARVKKISK